jgi:FSR family fosmidomycin resistance protein-like MFS transporter
LGVCGLAHAVIETICAGVLFASWQHEALPCEATLAFGLYNLLAFGTQPFLGLAVDWSGKRRAAALIGLGIVAGAAVSFTSWALPAIVLAGLGNAIFHLGAGSICLQLTPRRATGPGIFVAPGALGLFIGTQLGQTGNFVAWPFVVILAGLGLALTRLPLPAMLGAQPRPMQEWRWSVLVLVLLLGCIGGRSLVGFSVVMPWKAVSVLAITLTVAVVLGKALGGVLADRWGWGRIAVGGLALATPLLAYGANSPVAGILGSFLVNLTMAVTLVATANLLPGRPAFAFGLTCLALELGALPVIRPVSSRLFSEPWFVFGVMLAAVVALYIALRTAFSRVPKLFAAAEVYESILAH